MLPTAACGQRPRAQGEQGLILHRQALGPGLRGHLLGEEAGRVVPGGCLGPHWLARAAGGAGGRLRDVLNRDQSFPGARGTTRGSKARPLGRPVPGRSGGRRSRCRGRGWAEHGRAEAQTSGERNPLLQQSEAAAANTLPSQRAPRPGPAASLSVAGTRGRCSRGSYLVLLQLRLPGLLLRLLGLHQVLAVLQLVDAELVLGLRLRLLPGEGTGTGVLQSPARPGPAAAVGDSRSSPHLRQVSKSQGKSPGGWNRETDKWLKKQLE